MKNIPLRRIMKFVKPNLPYLVTSLVCSLFYAVGALLVPVFVGKVIDLFIGENQVDFQLMTTYLLAILGIAIFASISQYVQGICNNRLAFLTVRDVRNEIVAKLQKLPLKYFDEKPSGDITSNVLNDAEILSDGILLGFTQLFNGVVTIVGTLVLMLVYSPIIALIVVALTPISLFVAKFISSKTHSKFAKQAKLKGEATSFIEETVYNSKTIKAYGRENSMAEKFDELNQRLAQTTKEATFFSSLTNPTTRFVNSVVYATVALVGGLCSAGIITLGAGITAGVLTCLLNYAGQYAKPFNEISETITELQASAVGANRIFALLDEPNEPSDENGVELTCEGEVELKNVSFSYSENRELIKDLSVKVEKGKHVAIVGPTGCGKTTLINLLMRFYDVQKGAVLVDGTDVKDCTRESLRDGYGMVLQDSWIRNATIRDNLTLGDEIDDSEILNATKLCKIDGLIERMGGLNTHITDDSLSQGEKQLLCIARVMLSKPKMLILDEATSAVDVRTEAKINSAFDLLMQDKTSFIVAHRLSTIKTADLILVMKDGNVIEQGTHQDLLAQNGFYTNLYHGSLSVE